MLFKPKIYIPEPLSFFKCYAFAHVAKICKGKERYAKCGGTHDIENCMRQFKSAVIVVAITTHVKKIAHDILRKPK